MSYEIQQNPETQSPEIVIAGWEKGVASSPHDGLGNLQGANTSTEKGEIMCSFTRVQQSQVAGSGTFTQVNTNTVSVSGITLQVGVWVHITNGGTTGLSGDYYYVDTGHLSLTFSQDNGSFVTGITAGSATFTVYAMGKPIQSASETYTDSSGVTQYRYYILDDKSQTWVHDTATLSTVATPVWFTPDAPFTLGSRVASGLAVLNGWLTAAVDNVMYWKPTCALTFPYLGSYIMMNKDFHATLVGHQGKMYYTDGNFIGSVFPNTSLITGAANIQSYFSYTAVTTTCTVATLIGGSYPNLSLTPAIRVPVTFFTTGTLPSALSTSLTGTGYQISITYYVQWTGGTVLKTFEVYAALTGGSALDMQTGAAGTQFANTFIPVGGTNLATSTFTPQRLNLPFFEKAQCMAEVGNTVVIGGSSNTLYPWDQVSATPSSIIPLPENDVRNMVTVNSVAYAFAGQKGNVYVTNGSSASIALTVPDFCAGLAGTPNTYIEPYFTWGGAMYVRGRVWFSIQDQTATKTGNCGGIWSFVPAQNYSDTNNVGPSLRGENQNSYATYNGAASVLLPSLNQSAIGAQYWAGWYSSITNPLWGIDFSSNTPSTITAIESDLIPTGTMLEKQTFNQIEYKLATPLASGETITMSYRLNGTDSYTTVGTFIVESATEMSGYVPMVFEKGQWLQIRINLNPLASTSSSFCRLRQVIIR